MATDWWARMMAGAENARAAVIDTVDGPGITSGTL
jgi:hypothetical protein